MGHLHWTFYEVLEHILGAAICLGSYHLEVLENYVAQAAKP
jgi:hypothetical protein